MGVSIYYWAVPPSTPLFYRLCNERVFALLMTSLFSSGDGIYSFIDGTNKEENGETLEWVKDHYSEVLGTKAEAKQHIRGVRQALEFTRSTHPRIEFRREALVKTSQFIEERLLRELKRL